MHAKALKHCLCGETDARDRLYQWFGCSRNHNGRLWTILAWIIISIISLAIIIGISYLYFAVLTNAIARLFDGIVCENSVWQICDSIVNSQFGSPHSTTPVMMSFFIHLIFFIFVSTGITLCFTKFEDDDGKWRKNLWPAFWILYGAWVYMWFIMSLFLGKQLAVNIFPECHDYKGYAIILENLETRKVFEMCDKIRPQGFNMPAIEDTTLPGDWNTCFTCINKGFWPIFLLAIILPLLILGIVSLIKRFKQSLEYVRTVEPYIVLQETPQD
jgi:hypothetical protein